MSDTKVVFGEGGLVYTDGNGDKWLVDINKALSSLGETDPIIEHEFDLHINVKQSPGCSAPEFEFTLDFIKDNARYGKVALVDAEKKEVPTKQEEDVMKAFDMQKAM
jgi:hypothetical protein